MNNWIQAGGIGVAVLSLGLVGKVVDWMRKDHERTADLVERSIECNEKLKSSIDASRESVEKQQDSFTTLLTEVFKKKGV